MSEGLLSGVRKTILPNGLTLLVREDHATPVVCLNAWVNVGSNRETDDTWGWSHGIEHMLFKGTPTRRAWDISREIRSLGGVLNAATGYETTNYHITLPAVGFDQALDIHADVLRNAAFDPEELERERNVLLEELRMYRDVPDGFGFTWDEFMKVAFERHRFGKSVVGTEATLAETPRETILGYFQRGYVPENMIYVVAGAVDADRVADRVAATLGEMPSRPVDLARSDAEPSQERFRHVALTGDVEKAYFKIGFHTPHELHPDTPALHVLTHLLGVGRSSRLHQIVLEEKGYVSSIGIMEESGRDPGIVVVDGVTEPGDLDAALAATYDEVMRYRVEPVADRDLQKAVNNVRTEFVQSLETVRGQAGVLGAFEALRDYQDAEQYPDLIASVTPEDVSRAAEKYLSFEGSTVLTLLPGEKSEPDRSGEAAMREKLIALRPALGGRHATPITTPAEANGARVLNNMPKVQANSHSPALGEVAVRDLPNGSRLLVRPKPKLPLVALAAYGRAGVRFEPADKRGVGTLTSRSLIKGTRSKSYSEVADAIDHLGLTLAPFSDRDTCGFYLETMLDHLDEALDLFAEILIHPSFPEEAVERERQLQMAQIVQEQDDTLSHTMDVLMQRVFGDHPYGRSPLGTVETVSAITRDDLVRWHRRFFVPENLMLAAVGDVDADRITADLSRRLAPLASGSKPSLGEMTPPPIPGVVREKIVREKEQSVIAFGMRAPHFLSDDRLPLEVLNRVLAGMGGRLWDELRETRHLCYMVGSFYSALDGGGIFGTYIGTSPDLVDDAIAGLEGELARVAETPPTEEEFERAINSLCGAHLIALQTNGGQAAAFARCEALGIGYERVLNFPERVRKITLDDVQRVARDIVDLDHRAVIVLTPNAGE